MSAYAIPHLVLVLASLKPQGAIPKVNSELSLILTRDGTDAIYGTQRSSSAALSAQNSFDSFLDGVAKSGGRSDYALETELAKIGKDKQEHPDLYKTIEREYMFINGRPGDRGVRPKQPSPIHLTQAYRYAWEYFFIRPSSGREISGFESLCTFCISWILGPIGSKSLFLNYGLTVANTPLKGIGIDRLLLPAISAIDGEPSLVALSNVLALGATWNANHLGQRMNDGDSYEEDFSFCIKAGARGRIRDGWSKVFAQVNTLDMTLAEKVVAKRIAGFVAKHQSERELDRGNSSRPRSEFASSV